MDVVTPSHASCDTCRERVLWRLGNTFCEPQTKLLTNQATNQATNHTTNQPTKSTRCDTEINEPPATRCAMSVAPARRLSQLVPAVFTAASPSARTRLGMSSTSLPDVDGAFHSTLAEMRRAFAAVENVAAAAEFAFYTAAARLVAGGRLPDSAPARPLCLLPR